MKNKKTQNNETNLSMKRTRTEHNQGIMIPGKSEVKSWI